MHDKLDNSHIEGIVNDNEKNFFTVDGDNTISNGYSTDGYNIAYSRSASRKVGEQTVSVTYTVNTSVLDVLAASVAVAGVTICASRVR